MPANLFTAVTIGEDTYLIKKFDAKTGLKLARLVISKAAPLIPLLDKIAGSPKQDDEQTKQNAAVANMEDDQLYEAVGAVLEKLEDDDLDALVDKCLRVCYADLPAGKQPVMDESGHYGVEGVEYDMALTLRLCYEAIRWGAADFFGGNLSFLNRPKK